MKSLAIAIALIFVVSAAPLSAQDRSLEIAVWGSSVQMQGSNSFEDGFETELESGTGLGLTTGIFVTNRLSVEAGVFVLSSDAALDFDGVDQLSLGSIDLVPITLGAQFHFLGQSRFDPSIGGGVAYVMAEDLESADLTGVGLGAIELDDEVTLYVNGGLGFQFTPSIGVALDARYIPYKPVSASSVTGAEEDLDLSPLILSAGIRFRF